jgi:heme-degrading monooxygenase HmoA
MILEVVDFRIQPGKQKEFTQAVAQGVATCIATAKGFISYQLHHGIETPERFLLHIIWHTVEDHTVGFRQSEAFTQWRSMVGPYFAQSPVVEHFQFIQPSKA